MYKKNRLTAAAVSAALLAATAVSPVGTGKTKIEIPSSTPITAEAAGSITIDDLPEEYQYAADWIWNNRIAIENSTGSANASSSGRWNTIFDQIIDGKGTINYVVRWQSYESITPEQRQQFEQLCSDSINAWNSWLAGYENWPYSYVDVNIVGWAVLDESSIIDPQPDEIIYTNLTDYDASADSPKDGYTIPDKLPNAPTELSRAEHFWNESYEYPGGLDKRFDMYLWATYGFPDIGGCGGDWGQRLSDTAYLNMLDGIGVHVLEHEIGHGFGIPDYYGEEGTASGGTEWGGPPPGGFPDDGTSIMMAGSSTEITNFDGWLLRYMWTKIKDEEGRFDIDESAAPAVTETTTTTVTTTAPPVVTTTTTVSDITEAERVPAAVVSGSTDSEWSFNANGADAVELTFSGAAHGGGYGVVKSTDTQTEFPWEGRLDENGQMVLTVSLSEGMGEMLVRKDYAGVWSNELGAMEDITISLDSVILIYESGAPDTEIIWGDVDGNGELGISDAVKIMSYATDKESCPLTEAEIEIGDVYQKGDGLSNMDALSVQKKLAQIIAELPETYM
ncbi:MAG: hypothetical protein IJX77_08220 [Ruminococcus sp.]|nr:hypothetical protein [Ruminococcus sp.]MBQ8297751.1 hypothetical protein [Ruminococcus sp.]